MSKKNGEDIAGDEEANRLQLQLVNEQKLHVEIALLADRYNRWCDPVFFFVRADTDGSQ